MDRAGMIECPNIEKSVIRNHYDIVTPFYRLFWGAHIHHGYWDANESSNEAQIKLSAQLARRAQIQREATIYDIGRGMGGSSLWLARNLDAKVTGVTLSPIQASWARWTSRFRRLDVRPRFLCDDAEAVEFPKGQADCVWSIECTEHLFDKPAFFSKASTWLKPGGKFALCAWLAGDEPQSNEQRDLALSVCRGMICPSFGNQRDYIDWFEKAGLRVTYAEICTEKVKATWEICRRRVEYSGVRQLAKLMGKNHLLFLDHFDAILNAYNSGAMEYGMFVAQKSET